MRLVKLILGLILMTWIFYSFAADAPAVNPDQDDDVENNTELPVTDDSAEPQTDDDAEPQVEEEESPARFIPTEQLSRDLGVSFPADI